MGPGCGNAGLLFAMGLGFFICYFAKKADEEIKSLGRVVGLLILGLSTLFILLNLIGITQVKPNMKPMQCSISQGMYR